MNGRNDHWIRPIRTAGEALRLVCFPYAGGGPHVFQKWAEWLPPQVGLYAVHLPGRGARLGCAPVDRMPPIVDALVRALRPLQDLPLVFFGHSMGALLAFETLRALRAGGAREPRLLLASGCRPPQHVEEREKIHDLPDEAFIQKLRELGGTPPEILHNRELLELLMPSLRADFAVIDTYRYQPAAPLDCPITVVAGTQDTHACGSLMAGWGQHTSNVLSRHELQGGHFFIHSAEQELRRIVVRDVERWARV